MEILKKVLKLRLGDDKFKTLSNHVKNLDDALFSYIIKRLEIYESIVNKYKPKVRPALDPYVSSELGIYRRLDDKEIGEFLGYPECCINSFINGRVVIDEEHMKELKEIKNCHAVVLTSGFIPCSIKCQRAIKNKLIGYLSYEDFEVILKVEEELKKNLPHYHYGYTEYYEKFII
ncbi:DUF483 domain-containing protein [Methanocaldococcus indicus]|uniref:DUF483 domain-containing protein n=1 Tax=Methanocaldococcus indicus TaxID=213231 RepID=UPI003C6DA4CD